MKNVKKFDYGADVLYFAEDDMRSDLAEFLEHFNAESLKNIDRNELKEFLTERLLTDGVFGLDFQVGEPIHEAVTAMFIEDNEELVAKALRASGKDFLLGSDEIKELNASLVEHEVIKYELDRLADKAINNVLNGVQTERPEWNDIIRERNGDSAGEEILNDYYREEIQEDIQAYIEKNIDELLDEVSFGDRYSYERSDELQVLLSEKLMNGDVPLTELNNIGVLQDFEEVLGNEYFRDSGYTLADYFVFKEVADYVQNMYAITVALEELGEAIEKSNEEIIFPALEQKEADMEME